MVGVRRVFVWAMILLGIASSSMLIAASSSPTYAAGGSISDPTIDWDRQAESFIYYRYLYSCYSQHDIGKTSQDNTDSGSWFKLSLAGDFNSNTGYLAPNDKTTSCGDNGTVTTANTAVGFSGNMDAFCSVQPSAKSNGGSDKAGCMDGSNDFDMENGPSGQKRDFEQAVQAVNPANKNLYSNSDVPGYILYLVMKKSLEQMCGGGTKLTAKNTASSNGGNAASVTYVDPMSGKISTGVIYKYSGNKEDGSNIPDLYAKYDGKRDGGECGDFTTGKKNSLNQYADSFHNSVIKSWNAQVAAYFKANFKTNDTLNEAECGKAPDGSNPQESAGYGQCVAGITAKFNTQVDSCVSKLGQMSPDDRVKETKKCLKQALPNYTQAVNQIADPSIEQNADDADIVNEKTTCAIDGLGWAICPAMTFLAGLNDAAYGMLTNFLEVRPALISDEATFSAWERFRDFANIAFVISFMVIVYSQLTSVGISNYGIKKLLPKLFLAAVLVNISYWICAIAVDLSNIVGASIYDLFKSIGGSVEGGGGTGLDDQIGGLWSTVMAFVLGGAAVVLLLVVVITAPMTLLALGIVVLILIARQALVILLLIVAPLAFVSYILPNTDAWFTKWRKAFVATLMVYPVIGVIFGASELAAKILMNVSGDNGNLAGNSNDENLLKIIALGVLAVPLFTVPAVLKGSLAAIGGMSGKISGLQDRANGFSRKKLASSRLGEAKGAFDRRRQLRALDRRTNPDATRFGVPVGKVNTAFDRSRVGKYLGGDRGAAASTAAIHKATQEQIDNSIALLHHADPSVTVKNAREQLRKANETGDVVAARAATQVLSKQTGSRGIQELHEEILAIESNGAGGLKSNISENIRADISSAGLKGKDRALDTWSRHEGSKQIEDRSGSVIGTTMQTLAEHDASAGTARSLNEAELAGQSAAQLKKLADNGAMTKEQADRVLAAHAKGTLPLDNAKLGIFTAKSNETIDTRDQNREQNVAQARVEADKETINRAHEEALWEDASRSSGNGNP